MLFSAIALVFSFQSFAIDDTNCGNIAAFEFSNGSTNVTINNNQTYYIGDLPNNFYVDLLVMGYSESASFKVENKTTGHTYNIGENYLPYTFPGGNGAWNFGYGNFEVTAKIFKYNNCYGWYCDKEKINFTISCNPQCGNIAGIQLSNGMDTVDITNNGVYELSSLPVNFYSDVLVNGFSESASIKIENLTTGQTYNVGENYLPYTAPGGNSAWSYGTGDFKITANIFEFNNCQGNSCDEEILYFTINDTTLCGQIDGFEFSNFSSDPTLAITDGGSYDINNIPSDFNINVLTSGPIESAFNTLTNLDTGEVYTKQENVVPYTFPGATTSVWNLGCGTFNFCSSVYLSDNSNGLECDSACITFTITGCQTDDCGIVDRFEFSNATDTAAITDGETYNISDLPSDFYIDAIVAGDSESVRLTVTNLDSSEIITIVENYIPYTFPAGGASWSLGLGQFEVKAEVFEGNYCNYTLCDTQIITFTLIDEPDDDVCLANAGATVVDNNVFIFNVDQAFPVVTIIPSNDTVLPTGDNYSYACLISKGSNNAVRYWSNGLSTAIEQPGQFKVHLLVYDNTTLDLNTIVLGQTLITDLFNTINDNSLCASLDQAGFSITVINGGDDERVDVVDTKDKSNSEDENLIQAVGKVNQDILGTDVKLFPNPVANQLNVEINLSQNEEMNYRMFDLNGKLVLDGILSSNISQISTKELADGLYVLKLVSTSRNLTKKILVKH